MTADINIHPEVCHADNFPEWNEKNNPERLPAIQYQPWADPGPFPERFGGYVLRMPPAFETQNLLNAGNEKDAFKEAKVIAERYNGSPQTNPPPVTLQPGADSCLDLEQNP